jgi:hypothetical protein
MSIPLAIVTANTGSGSLTVQPDPDQTTPGSSGTGELNFKVSAVSLGQVERGQTVDFDIPFSFSTYRIKIVQMVFDSPSLFTLIDVIPLEFNQGGIDNPLHLQARLTVPQNMALANYSVPFTAYAEDLEIQKGQSMDAISFTIVSSEVPNPPPLFIPSMEDAQRLLRNPYFLVVLVVTVSWFGYYYFRDQSQKP